MGKSIVKHTSFALFSFLLLFSASSCATVNTLTNTGEYSDGDKKICIYEGSGRVETIVINASRACPSKKTFH